MIQTIPSTVFPTVQKMQKHSAKTKGREIKFHHLKGDKKEKNFVAYMAINLRIGKEQITSSLATKECQK